MSDDIAITLILPLRSKESISLDDFYDYWLNAHITLPPRVPGVRDGWLHVVSFDRQLFAPIDGVSNRPASEDEFHGIPEATFSTFDDLATFAEASKLQMDDGENFLASQVAYRSLGASSKNSVDKLDDPAPQGHETSVRHLVFLRGRRDRSVDERRDAITDKLVPSMAASPLLIKLRHHLFEEVEVTLDHPGVEMTKAENSHYDAAFEIVVATEADFASFCASQAWIACVDTLRETFDAVHPVRVERCIATVFNGRPTLAGIRGVRTADAIHRLNARNQMTDEMSNMFLAEPLPKRP